MTVVAACAELYVEAACTSVGDRRRTILQLFQSARRQVELSMFRCDDPLVFEAIAAASARGVKVNVLVTARARGGARKLLTLRDRLLAAGAAVRVYTDPVVKYHAKYMVVDDGPAVVASFNFTQKCFTRTCDACIVTHDPAVVEGLRALMAADAAGRPLPASLTPRLIVGPERARLQLVELLGAARSSIQLIDPKLSDPSMLRLLEERRRAGVTIEVLGSRRFGALKSHGKLLLIDDRIAVVGSLALAPISLDFRREVALLTEDAALVTQLRQLFHTMNGSRARPGNRPPLSSDGLLDWRSARKEVRC